MHKRVAKWLPTCTREPKVRRSSPATRCAEVSCVCEAGGSGSEELKKCPPRSPAVL